MGDDDAPYCFTRRKISGNNGSEFQKASYNQKTKIIYKLININENGLTVRGTPRKGFLTTMQNSGFSFGRIEKLDGMSGLRYQLANVTF